MTDKYYYNEPGQPIPQGTASAPNAEEGAEGEGRKWVNSEIASQ